MKITYTFLVGMFMVILVIDTHHDYRNIFILVTKILLKLNRNKGIKNIF